MSPKPCKICLAEHDEEIHQATVSVHEWFHEQVMLGLYEDVPVEATEPEPQLVAAS